MSFLPLFRMNCDPAKCHSWMGQHDAPRLCAEDRREHALGVIERNARLQADLIDDLLDISRIVIGKIRLRLRSLQLRPSLRALPRPCAQPPTPRA